MVTVTPLTAKIARLAGVKRVRDLVGPDFVPLAPNGAPRLNTLNDVIDRRQLGRRFPRPGPSGASSRVGGPTPTKPNEMVMTANAARLLGVHVGQVVPLGFYTDAQEALPAFGTPTVAPPVRASVKLVGIAVLNNPVVQDDIDGAYGFVVLTPALVREAVAVSPAAAAPGRYALQLDHGGRGCPSGGAGDPATGPARGDGRVPRDRSVS